ncbi:MAG: septum formation protein Maf [Candidatus Eremiobacteraeota bacterium]|nr:septum formation protein Maf [Candidatus Eremiobacteraeota bacterium]
MTVLREITLASVSPRRLELLRSLALEVTVVPSTYDERFDAALKPEQLASVHAKEKAREVAQRVRRGLIVAADTVVDIDGRACGKPLDGADAARILSVLSGREHLVHTAFAIINTLSGACVTGLETTSVRFFKLSVLEINQYVASGEPMDKAGAYGIQGLGATLVQSISGDFYTVMGFPIGRFARSLADLGFYLDLANTKTASAR